MIRNIAPVKPWITRRPSGVCVGTGTPPVIFDTNSKNSPILSCPENTEDPSLIDHFYLNWRHKPPEGWGTRRVGLKQCLKVTISLHQVESPKGKIWVCHERCRYEKYVELARSEVEGRMFRFLQHGVGGQVRVMLLGTNIAKIDWNKDGIKKSTI